MDTRTVTCFRNIGRSEEVLDVIEAKAAKLRRIEPRVMRCRVILERPRAGQRSGNGCRALVRALVPGTEIVGDALEGGDGAESAAIAVAQAFRAVERQLAGHRTHRRRAPTRQGLFHAA